MTLNCSLIVGINYYPHLVREGLYSHLGGPVNDVQDVQQWLLGHGWLPENILQQVSRRPERDVPQYHQIDSAFRRIFKKVDAGGGDSLFFYFAGHGVSDGHDSSILLMADASSDYPGACIQAEKYLKGIKDKNKFKRIFFVTDCCLTHGKDWRGKEPDWAEGPLEAAAGAWFVRISAGIFNQAARESPGSAPRGYLTKALMEGLRGEASEKINGGWFITKRSLRTYLRLRMKEMGVPVGTTPADQWPAIECSSDEEDPLIDGLEPKKSTLEMSSKIPGAATITHKTGSSWTVAVSAGATASIQLYAGIYTVTFVPKGAGKAGSRPVELWPHTPVLLDLGA